MKCKPKRSVLTACHLVKLCGTNLHQQSSFSESKAVHILVFSVRGASMECSKDAVSLCFDSNNNIFQFWLECVRQGRADIIQNYCNEEEKRKICSQVFKENRTYAFRICMIIWTEAVKIVERMETPNGAVDKKFEECVARSLQATTPWMLIELSEECLMDFARIVNKTICDPPLSPVFIKFQKYIKSHIYEPLNIEIIADSLYISKSHLSHTIKRETGETVHRWILKEKINMARLMLSNKTYCMNEIWSLLGFCSQSHFAKCFRQITGVTPSQFRLNVTLSETDEPGNSKLRESIGNLNKT